MTEQTTPTTHRHFAITGKPEEQVNTLLSYHTYLVRREVAIEAIIRQKRTEWLCTNCYDAVLTEEQEETNCCHKPATSDAEWLLRRLVEERKAVSEDLVKARRGIPEIQKAEAERRQLEHEARKNRPAKSQEQSGGQNDDDTTGPVTVTVTGGKEGKIEKSFNDDKHARKWLREQGLSIRNGTKDGNHWIIAR